MKGHRRSQIKGIGSLRTIPLIQYSMLMFEVSIQFDLH